MSMKMIQCPYCMTKLSSDTLEYMGPDEADFIIKDNESTVNFRLEIDSGIHIGSEIIHASLTDTFFCGNCGKIIVEYQID